jgi:hypothetical protein
MADLLSLGLAFSVSLLATFPRINFDAVNSQWDASV